MTIKVFKNCIFPYLKPFLVTLKTQACNNKILRRNELKERLSFALEITCPVKRVVPHNTGHVCHCPNDSDVNLSTGPTTAFPAHFQISVVFLSLSAAKTQLPKTSQLAARPLCSLKTLRQPTGEQPGPRSVPFGVDNVPWGTCSGFSFVEPGVGRPATATATSYSSVSTGTRAANENVYLHTQPTVHWLN